MAVEASIINHSDADIGLNQESPRALVISSANKCLK